MIVNYHSKFIKAQNFKFNSFESNFSLTINDTSDYDSDQ